MLKEVYKKNSFYWIIISLIIFFIFLFIILNFIKDQNVDRRLLRQQEQKIADVAIADQRPAVTSNEDFTGEKTHFTFSPNKQYIAFVQNVFEEYGSDWDKYWALKLFNPENITEKILLVDDVKMSSYEWLNNKTIRIYHNSGTGIRSFKDVDIDVIEPIFYKNYKYIDNNSFWQIDKDYVMKVREGQEAKENYIKLTQ
ncbi:hypothetical protein HY750_02525 [Candidatus Kuenenbacteria bacterium]|nr:hypothetical protein [Candidatus Kuenenbacteria bacterium]